jgi:hypothetical protein
MNLSRTRWLDAQQGSDCPLDRLIDESEATVSVRVRQLSCREGGNARSFARGRENLKHVGQIDLGEELFRQLVESEGKAVLKASAQEQLERDWSASACKAKTPQGQETTKLYVSADGVLVPTITQAEKDKRRKADPLIQYVASRQEMILYDRCDQQGWNVGSGPMESMCGVTTDRIKGRGRRWDMDNAEAMMALEALYQSSGLWDKYWANALYHLN